MLGRNLGSESTPEVGIAVDVCRSPVCTLPDEEPQSPGDTAVSHARQGESLIVASPRRAIPGATSLAPTDAGVGRRQVVRSAQ